MIKKFLPNIASRDIKDLESIEFTTRYIHDPFDTNAEIDTKLYQKRQNKAIDGENMQKFYDKQYDNQYNVVIRQVGIYDGTSANLHQIFENDP